MSLVDDIKNQVKKSAGNKQKFLYFKSGTKIRVRFLEDMESGLKVLFHDSYAEGINTPCQELFDRECKYCNNTDLRHRELYIWSVWDHEAKEVKLLMNPVNSFSPIPSLVAMYETYGTLTDRDYVIQKNGEGTSSNYSVIPMDKSRFINKKAKPFTEAKILEFLDKGFSDDEDQEDESPKKKSSKAKPKKTAKPSASDYEEYTARDLYDECIARGLDAEKKKQARYYINLLEEDDMEMDADEEEEATEVDYDSMTTKELYQLCIDKGLKVRPKKPRDSYLELLEELEEDEAEEDDWEEEEAEDEDEW